MEKTERKIMKEEAFEDEGNNTHVENSLWKGQWNFSALIINHLAQEGIHMSQNN